MIDYRSCEEKFEYSPIMESVYTDLTKRIKPNRVREDTWTGRDPDGKNPFLDVFLATKGEPYPIRLAKAIVESWMVTSPELFDGDILVGFPRPKRPIYEHFSFGIFLDREALNYPAYADVKDEHLRLMNEMENEFVPLGWYYLYDEARRRFVAPDRPDDYHMVGHGLWWTGGYQGHTVPNYDILMKKGIGGVHAEVCARLENEADEHKRETLTACKIILEGLRDWILMNADYAEKKASEGGELAGRYMAVAENSRAVSWKAPETLYEAAQLIWFYSLWDWVDCVGRLDQYLWPFFEKAVKEDKQAAEDIVASLMMKFLEHGIHNITVGGVKVEDGEPAENDLTFLLLQILRRTHETHPRMSVRFAEKTDPRLMALTVKMWSEGMSDPSVVSDTLVIPSFVNNYGVAEKDARNYSVLGCQELEIPGKSNFGCEDGQLNLAKVLEFTLNDGKSRYHGDFQIGLKTGRITDYDNFEDFFAAYESQVQFFTKHFVDLANMGQEMRGANYAKLVKTPFTEACIEKGLNLDEGGAVYNYGCIETAGAGVVADSMTAIKKLVFEEKLISKETLEKAIAADFVGYEKERMLLLNKAPKYGNDDPEADEMMARVLRSFWGDIKNYKSVRGQEFTGACSLLSGGIFYGSETWATPDGRKKGEPLGNTIGPRPGNDKNGLTALLNSVAKLPLNYGLGGTTCNILIPTTVMKTPEMRRNIEALMTTYLREGGQMGQITTACVEDMIDAKKNPEAHQDLIVRVGGFSIRFCELAEYEQDEIIARYSK